jgi:hypothetical protein
MGNGLTRNELEGKISRMNDLRAEPETVAAFFVGRKWRSASSTFQSIASSRQNLMTSKALSLIA